MVFKIKFVMIVLTLSNLVFNFSPCLTIKLKLFANTLFVKYLERKFKIQN